LKILLVDDEPDVRKSLSNFLNKLGHQVVCAVDGLEALQKFHSESFDLVITDVRMPSMDGLELMRQIKKIERSAVDVIIITGHGDMDSAIRALKYGAYDYLQKPINVRELTITIERSLEYRALRNNYNKLKEEFQERVAIETREFRGKAERLREAYLQEIGLGDIGVYSGAMRQVIELAEKYSTDRVVPVLIEGETGTGKELIARFIHYYGQGSTLAPFVAINCGAMPRDLFESELFGHESGAYTGATMTGRMGKIELANGGTLFLDEIGEMPLSAQVDLLRVLEEKKFYRLGGVKEIPIDVRFISATNKDLSQEIETKKFRPDLFYRINMGTIQIPPLRERKEDILPLALRFINRAVAQRGRRFGRFTRAAEEYLNSLQWPGNVRQLKNAMERLALLGPWDPVDVSDLSFIGDSTLVDDLPLESKRMPCWDDFDLPNEGLDLEKLNRQVLSRALEKNKGNQTLTAQYLGISRRVLQGRLKKFGILK
jgi:two-component system response regulator AtoC